jgi:hypothetical protein
MNRLTSLCTTYSLIVEDALTAAGCLPCQERAAHSASTGTTLALVATPGDADHADPTPTASDEDSPLSSRWSGVVGVEGEVTGDGRLIEPNALRWETPMPLRYVSADVGGHEGAVVVGTIESLSRTEGGQIAGSGTFDLESDAGREASRLVSKHLMNGISMDLDDVSFEVRVKSELVDATLDPFDPAGMSVNDDGTTTVMELKPDDEVMITTDGRIRAATLVAIPAFAGATIEVDDSPTDLEPEADAPSEKPEAQPLVASAAPVAPPAAWFEDPHLPSATALTVTEEGRVFGHLALWGTCHLSHTARGKCITPPHSRSGYAHFRVGAVRTAEGHDVAVGHLTLDTRHPDLGLNAVQALAHYDHTGFAVSDVAVGEDSIGIWVAGALRPQATPEQVRVLRASPISGDWREMGTGLELVAALCVNVPGFPVPRPQGLVADGSTRSLVAAGMLPPERVITPGTDGALSTDDLRYLKRLAARERATTAAKVKAFALKRRVEKTRLPVLTG